MTTKESRLGGHVLREGSAAPIHVISGVATDLVENGKVAVSFEVSLPKVTTSDSVEKAVLHAAQMAAIDHEVEEIRRRLVPYCRDVELADLERVERSRAMVDVHVVFTAIPTIHFTEAPWHANNQPGSDQFTRLIDTVKRGRPFTAVYTFTDQPHDRTGDRFVVQTTLVRNLREAGVTGCQLGVVRQDWPLEPGGTCRIDVRIEP